MVVSKRWREASIYIIIALFSMFVSVILFLVGFSTDSWVSKTYQDKGKRIYGLWKYTRYFPWGKPTDEYKLSGLLIKSDEIPPSVTTSGKVTRYIFS